MPRCDCEFCSTCMKCKKPLTGRERQDLGGPFCSMLCAVDYYHQPNPPTEPAHRPVSLPDSFGIQAVEHHVRFGQSYGKRRKEW